QWLAKQEIKPDAFMTSSDAVAAGLVSQAKRLGYSLPEDFSVIGFDNIEISHLLDITTIDYSIHKQAENAFKMINNDLTLQKLTPEELAFTLIVRKTTK
ncbi:MAG: substrate-binding domain-containing protein, partial [Carnobacterium sp.]|uniref:substrate-binding domain-containing protein n=1 Tax=Carnobacterium sp. TaxID=48221 RepID=UPI0033147815